MNHGEESGYDCIPQGRDVRSETTQAEETRRANALRKRYELCHAAMNILGDIVTLELDERPLTSSLVQVGRFRHGRDLISLRILGPTRLDGGLALLTHEEKNKPAHHCVFIIDDLYSWIISNSNGTEYSSKLETLIQRAVRKRDQFLKGRTNYFSGGQVMKIL